MTPRVVRTVEEVRANVRADVEWSLRTVAAHYRAAGKHGDDVPLEWINEYIDRLTQAVLAPLSVTAEQVEAIVPEPPDEPWPSDVDAYRQHFNVGFRAGRNAALTALGFEVVDGE